MKYVFVVITLLIGDLLPRFIKVIPVLLIANIVLTTISIFSDVKLNTVGDLGAITQTLPNFLIPNVPFTYETLKIIAPYALALSIVGLLETLLTSSIIDDMTETGSDKIGRAHV